MSAPAPNASTSPISRLGQARRRPSSIPSTSDDAATAPQPNAAPMMRILTNLAAGACVLVVVVWSVLDSPRRRRRLLLPAVAVVLAIPLIYLGVHFSSPGSKGEATGPEVAGTGYAEPKQVPFTAAKKRQVRTALAQFIATAVARKDVGSSWDMA